MYITNRISLCVFINLFLAAPLLADDAIEVSARLLSFNYEEFDQQGQSLNKENGLIPGLTIATSRTNNNFTGTAAAEVADGQVAYDGQTQSGAPHNTDTNERLYRLFYQLGWSPENSESSLYGKLAWQQWDRDILPNDNVAGLFEQYQWWSFELGFLVSIYKEHSNSWLLDIGISTINHGTIEVDLNAFGYGKPELDLGDGTGATLALIYQRKINSNSHLGFSLRQQRWSFGRSNTKTVSNGISSINIAEPRSISQHSMLSVDYTYNF